jgi:hypothetical protein
MTPRKHRLLVRALFRLSVGLDATHAENHKWLTERGYYEGDNDMRVKAAHIADQADAAILDDPGVRPKLTRRAF